MPRLGPAPAFGYLIIMKATAQSPTPDYIVLCSDSVDWKTHAELVASLGKSILLIGACDEAFIAALQKKHNLSCEIEPASNKILLWNPARAGLDCHDAA